MRKILDGFVALFHTLRAQLPQTWPPSEGRKAVRRGGKEFHTDLSGSPIYPERYDRVGSYSEGRAWVEKGRESFHIDLFGKPVYSERYETVGSFSLERTASGRGKVRRAWVWRKDGRCSQIDWNGNPVSDERYDGVMLYQFPGMPSDVQTLLVKKDGDWSPYWPPSPNDRELAMNQ